jgi:hypothetical protein
MHIQIKGSCISWWDNLKGLSMLIVLVSFIFEELLACFRIWDEERLSGDSTTSIID